MQYQIYEKDTRNLIAWLDPEEHEAILADGYELQEGENLHVVEVSEENEKIKVTCNALVQKPFLRKSLFTFYADSVYDADRMLQKVLAGELEKVGNEVDTTVIEGMAIVVNSTSKKGKFLGFYVKRFQAKFPVTEEDDVVILD